MGTKGLDFSIVSDVEKALADMGKVQARQEGVIRGLKSQNRESKRGGGLLDTLTSKMAGFISIGAGIGGLVAAMKSLNEEHKELASRLEGQTPGIKDLLTISAPGDLQRNLLLASYGSARYNVPEAASQALMFNVMSTGGTNAEVRQAQQMFLISEQVGPLSEGIKDLHAIFKDVGNFREILNQVGVAAKEAKAKPATLMAQMLDPAKIAKAFAGTDAQIMQEVMALLAVSTVGSRNPEIARTQLVAFLEALRKDPEGRFSKLSPLGAVRAYAALSEEGRLAITGSEQRANIGGRVSERMGAIEQTLGQIQVAGEAPWGEGWFSGKIRQAMANPQLAAAHRAGRTRARKDLALKIDALESQERDAIAAAAQEIALREDWPWYQRKLLNWSMDVDAWTSLSPRGMLESYRAIDKGDFVPKLLEIVYGDSSPEETASDRAELRRLVNELLDVTKKDHVLTNEALATNKAGNLSPANEE